ncbi:MAG: orotidine-5'-phosphate decarboxylase [Nitriliruptoraceae bacterium]|nr:orotidine-5'-phosphate decarboxylase [Nitriliruptoraceae bacterium]
MTDAADRLIVALDVPTLEEADALAAALVGHVGWFKVGLELFSAHGPAAVERIGAHGPIFLDLKLHDIPTTVERAARRLAALEVGLLTVHAGGGAAMVAAAVSGLGDGGRILAVTVLTSTSDDELAALGSAPAADQVPRLADLATRAGAPGLVCAPKDLTVVRETVGDDVLVVTPGVRPAGGAADDHARAATPAEAMAAGADLLVVGRPITAAGDPVAAADAIVAALGPRDDDDQDAPNLAR